LILFQADADLRVQLVTAVRKHERGIDFASALDSNLQGLSDPEVLDLAASQGRILVTHDRRTRPSYFRRRLDGGKTSPGLFLVSQFAPLRPVVEALILVWAASDPADWQNQVRHLPSLSRHVFSLEAKPHLQFQPPVIRILRKTAAAAAGHRVRLPK